MIGRFVCAVGCLVLIGAACGARQEAAVAPSVPAPAWNTAANSAALDAFVVRISQQITKKHLTSVAVIGAVGGRSDQLTQDGTALGDEVSAALTKQIGGFQVVDRTALRDFVRKIGISDAMVVSDALANCIARLAKVSGFIVVRMGGVSNGRVKIAAEVYRTGGEDGELQATTKTEVEISADQKRDGFRPLDSIWNRPTRPIEESKLLAADRSPQCVTCPKPEFTT